MAENELQKLLKINLAQAPQAAAPVAQAEEAKPSNNEMWAQAILGLAPILAGAALGGVQGGVAGAEAGKTSLKALELSKEKEKEAQALAQKAKRERITDILALAKEEREAKGEERKTAAERRAEERQLAELALSRQRLGLETEKIGKEKQPTSPQFLAGTYARRMEQSENIFDRLANEGFDRSSRSIESILPGELQSKARRANDQAERNFVNALLRRESGAAISEAEYQNAEQQYFPRPGDDPETIAQKKANRLQAVAGLQAEAGPAMARIPLIEPQMPKKAAGFKLPSNEAVAAPAKPDFGSMTDEQLKKYLGK